MSADMQSLIKDRKYWVEANKRNGFEEGIKRLLTDLYLRLRSALTAHALCSPLGRASAFSAKRQKKEDGSSCPQYAQILPFYAKDPHCAPGAGMKSRGPHKRPVTPAFRA